GMAEQHFQTMTVSQEKVLTALLGWAAAKPGWQDAFMWNNIGEQFSSSDHGTNRAVVQLRDRCIVVGARGSSKAASASG
ncbi:hypothetical protein SIN09_16540, partial [Streptomyces sp. F8]|nr:hypothetical protein [Streptomyces sp. F8]